MKKVISLLMVVCLVTVMLAGCASSKPAAPATPSAPAAAAPAKPAAPSTTAPAAKAVNLKLGHVLNKESPFHAGSVKFSDLVKQKSNGSVSVEVYPSALLGNDRELAEGLQLGTVDMAVTATAPVSGFAPKIQIFDLPYLFTTVDQAYKVLDGAIGQQLLDDFYKASGVKALAFWENGWRQLTNGKKDIKTAADAKGMKIRVQEIACHVDFWNALGVNPTPMAWTEVYTALQQGTVDGQENPIQTIYTQKVYEVQKHISLTNHVYAPALIMIADKQFKALSADQQKALTDAARESATYERQFIADLEKKAITELPGLGVTITKTADIDMASFQAAAQPILEKYGQKLGVADLIKQIQATK